MGKFQKLCNRVNPLNLILVTCLFLGITLGSSDTSICYAANDSKELIIGVPTDRCPMFYVDDNTGEIEGIGVDLMIVAAEKSGYTVSFKAIEETNLKEALDNDTYDIVMPFGSAVESASGKSSVVSDNLIQTPFVLVTVQNKDITSINSIRVGMLKSLGAGAETIKQLYPGIEIEMYESMPDCISALRTGEVDALLHNSYVWSYVLQKPAYEDLVIRPTEMFSMDFRAGTLDTPEGRALIERLNEGINKIPGTERQAIILDYTTRRLYKFDFYDYLYEYSGIILLSTILLILLVLLIIGHTRAYKRKQEAKLQQLVDTDALTGVLSLDGFRKRVTELIKQNPNTPYIISYNNIKDFKYINEQVGRAEGDKLLKFWAERSAEVIYENEAIGRINADHILVFRVIGDDERIKHDAEYVFEPVKDYFINQGKKVKVRLTSGIYVLTPEDFENIDVDRMIDFAKMAEKRADISKGGFELYNPKQWEKGRIKAEIISRLSLALTTNEIEVWYQPQVDYVTGKITGAEALCRWKHTDNGYISPGDFIPTLEESGHILELDSYVWEKVCQDLHRWNEQGFHRCVSVNLSRYDISGHDDISEVFISLVNKYDISVDQLHIEITETAYVEDSQLLISTSEKLREYGFQVEMDDFGSGYSSLNMLKDVIVDRIKLDLNFMANTGNQEMGRVILQHVIQMISDLNVSVLAEGVETIEQAEYLQNIGCSEMQGYYFYKPMPVTEVELVFQNSRG